MDQDPVAVLQSTLVAAARPQSSHGNTHASCVSPIWISRTRNLLGVHQVSITGLGVHRDVPTVAGAQPVEELPELLGRPHDT